nr:hypothetical protein [Porphyrobacter sp. AAP82]
MGEIQDGANTVPHPSRGFRIFLPGGQERRDNVACGNVIGGPISKAGEGVAFQGSEPLLRINCAFPAALILAVIPLRRLAECYGLGPVSAALRDNVAAFDFNGLAGEHGHAARLCQRNQLGASKGNVAPFFVALHSHIP